MLIKDLDLKTPFEKVDFIGNTLRHSSHIGLGIFVIPKEDIIFSASKLNIKDEDAIEECFNTINNFDENDILYVSSYESENFFILKRREYKKIQSNLGFVDDARHFFYNTVSLDMNNVENKDVILLFVLNH